MRKRNITNEQRDNFLKLSSKGISSREIARILNVGDSSVSRTLIAYELALTGKIDELRSKYHKYQQLIAWACEKAGVTLEPEEPEELEEPEPVKPKPDNTALAFVQLAESLRALTSAVQAIDQRLSAMQMTQAGFRSDVAEQAKKIVEAIHVEGDIITQENNKMIDLLAGIKCNTRKRGGGNDAG